MTAKDDLLRTVEATKPDAAMFARLQDELIKVKLPGKRVDIDTVVTTISLAEVVALTDLARTEWPMQEIKEVADQAERVSRGVSAVSSQPRDARDAAQRREEFRKRGLTVSTWRVLAVLADRGVCGFGELAELTSIEPATLSRFVEALDARRPRSAAGDRPPMRGR